MEKKRNRSKAALVGFIVFLILAAIAASLLILQSVRQRKANRNFEELKNLSAISVNTFDIAALAGMNVNDDVVEPEQDVLSARGIEIPQKNLDWDALHEECEDIYAWIYVPDTNVDYPVLQHPSNDSYYLNYNMDGSRGLPGCIYTEKFYTSKDFSDIHTVIYGHNLKDMTMFSTLHNFEDEALLEEDHYIFIYTEDYTFVYQIFAAYEYSSIHLLANFDYTNEYVYAQFLKNIHNNDAPIVNVRQDIEVTTEDQIVTLSTCTTGINYDENMRFLVTGVLLNPRKGSES